ncbi:hypothetical protein OEZ86_012260 [Tetradesmus obliquus]|nr:hypothetical protein OEZ86_012260 [Tetradesmus obliquus]
MGATFWRNSKSRKLCLVLFWSKLIILVLVVQGKYAAGRGVSGDSSQWTEGQQQHQDAEQVAAVGTKHSRQLLQTSYVATVCDAYSGSVDDAAVTEFASKLLGDSRLQLVDARFTGACNAFGLATLSQPHALAKFFGGAVVLSTGDAAAAVGDLNDGSRLVSSDLQQSGDASIGSYTYDAAVLEIDISIAGSSSSGSDSEVVLSYLFGSEEYGSSTPNPDAFSLTAKTSSGGDYTDIAILPGGVKIPPPSAAGSSLPVGLYSNTGSRYRTALNGFTEVVPTQGFQVLPGGIYTLRISVADANNGLVDSVVMLPVGGLKLLATPRIGTGGPYAVAPNTQLTLNGAKSTSDNGAILQYLWRIFPYNSTAAVTTAKGPTVTLQAPAIGQYNVTLDVWDVLGGHASGTTALSVDAGNVLDWWSATPTFATPAAAALPKPTAVLALNGSTGSAFTVKARSGAGAVVQLDGSASSDAKGSKLAYTWKITQTQPSVAAVNPMLGFNQPAKFVYSFDPGAYLINLDVSGPGGTGTAQAMLTVLGNNPPVASAGGPYTTTVGAAVVVSAEKSTDVDGDPLTYSWVLYRGDLPIGNYSGPALNMKLNKAGTYTLKLTVNDDRGGASSTMATLTSYDAAAVPAAPPPVVYAPTPAAPPATTTTVIAAVPAPPPSSTTSSSGLRLPRPPPAGTPVLTQSVYQPTVYTPPVTTTTSTGNMLSPYVVPPAPVPSPAPAMCLFTKDGNSSTNPWDASLSNANWSNLNIFSLTNTYWAPCQQSTAAPVSGSSSAPAASTGTPDPLKSNAVIRSPEAFVTATGSATQVYLDATGSTAAVGRSLIAFSWNVMRKSDGATITQVDGLRTPVWLGPGVYSVKLTVTDTSGQTATASKEFSLGDVAETLAYISSPGSFVDQVDGGSLDVQLSAAGSKGGPGRSITSYRWAVLRLPDNARVSTPEGPSTTVSVPVGSYRAYLVVFDSGGGNATTSKDFVVGSRDPSGASAVITWPPALVQASTEGNGLTTVALDGSGSGPARNGSAISQYIWAVVSMPNKQPVANATGRLTTVSLPAGFYQVGLLVVGSDGNTATARKNFAISSTSANVNSPPIVKAGLALSGTAGGSLKITGVTDPDGDAVAITWALMDQATGKTTQGKGAAVSLVGQAAGSYLLLITANDGRVLELDADSFNLLPASSKLDAYVWELKQRSTGEQVATVYGKLGHFELSAVDTYDLRLTAYDTKGKGYSSTGSVKVVAPSAAAGLNSWTSCSGTCGPFSAKQYTTASLSCPSLSITGAGGKLSYAWKIIAPNGVVSDKSGIKPSVVGLGPGHYRVELAIGVNGAPTGQNTAYYRVSYLKVQANNKLLLSMPQPLCAGQVVSLTAPPLVQQDGSEPQYSWQVVWLESQQLQGYKEVLQGEGSTFGFTLQTGHYDVLMLARMADGAVIQGFGNITALPCLKCQPGVVNITLPKGKCAADSSLATQALLAPIPEGAAITWAAGTSTKPGQRKVQILAKSVAANLSSSCSATVNFADAEPPTVKLLRSGGACISAANAKWACWTAKNLVSLSDNCQAVGDIGFMLQCAEGSTGNNCRVLAGGQVCVKAVKAGQLVRLRVLAKDVFGNLAQPFAVPVQVMAAAPASAGCVAAAFSKPEDAALVKQ